MLNMCADEHFPIIFDTNLSPLDSFSNHICPICYYKEIIEKITEQKTKLESKCEELEKEIKNIKDKIIKKTHSQNFTRSYDVELNL